jgi:hypothetical protein
MTFVAHLWLPVVVSAFFVFLASSIIWTMMPHHQKEWHKLPGEAAVLAALRAQPAEPGLYALPGIDHPADRKSAAWKADLERGPIAYVTLVRGGMAPMGPKMFTSLVGNLVVSFFCAYIASHVLQPGASYLEVFRVVGTLGFMSYSFAKIQDSIWFGWPWRSLLAQAADALLFGCLMGGTFGWLWK